MNRGAGHGLEIPVNYTFFYKKLVYKKLGLDSPKNKKFVGWNEADLRKFQIRKNGNSENSREKCKFHIIHACVCH